MGGADLQPAVVSWCILWRMGLSAHPRNGGFRLAAAERTQAHSLVPMSRHLNPEEALQQLGAILDSSEDAIFARNLRNEIISWNRGAERIFGYSARDAIGQSVEMLTPEDAQ